ncbi:hypothetical protein GCM10009092_29850 [Bowmanella denitrificans]|uniref:Uncharacterized protein n=1 Tax=Bowmanella denitrificans TaxID=366582 RepID=A0ABP3H6L8_9ALTE
MLEQVLQYFFLMTLIFALSYTVRKVYVFVVNGTFERRCSALEFIALMVLSVVLSSSLDKMWHW